jgi:hypothetical protein
MVDRDDLINLIGPPNEIDVIDAGLAEYCGCASDIDFLSPGEGQLFDWTHPSTPGWKRSVLYWDGLIHVTSIAPGTAHGRFDHSSPIIHFELCDPELLEKMSTWVERSRKHYRDGMLGINAY